MKVSKSLSFHIFEIYSCCSSIVDDASDSWISTNPSLFNLILFLKALLALFPPLLVFVKAPLECPHPPGPFVFIKFSTKNFYLQQTQSIASYSCLNMSIWSSTFSPCSSISISFGTTVEFEHPGCAQTTFEPLSSLVLSSGVS
jgi:hypothetical protein